MIVFKSERRLPGFRSRFEFSFILAVLTAIPLLVLNPPLALLPPVVFGLLCLAGPFIQRFSFFLPVVLRGHRDRAEISLTFDDGPDPETTPRLLELLARYGVKGVFFVIGEKAAANPDLIREILDEGHEIGNHSESHDVFLMLRGRKKIAAEIRSCQETLAGFSIIPKTFRPPVGITNPHLRPILESLKMRCVGFSCRPLDFGNRRLKGMKDKVLKKIQAGDILLLHDCRPHGAATVDQWLEQIEGILSGLQEKRLQAVPLSYLMDWLVMERQGGCKWGS
ncbi:MAG: polysaccharide deacetylase family protein [Deltaproteobacteria bacterium]|jgi:peptidoglycan-N-acetylglucosamine deacetylase|nr:polysaccharide deacetylase family protein [Deltaproteobacteria bacterium]MBT4268676.1 polysaccharide deacetylase family protein [Deltaproteobacteria bacterium]MBT6504342.1 polysaccharide deacetylase family protein [Deltaproteobacteria bacterium]MBT6614526.1 polysaccharide deacetylase family protein [Deltaproteobacteria bacterium]MBT7154572.1 polysaccharide deacetylase family protein [Deltaproteobacteria bacterium]